MVPTATGAGEPDGQEHVHVPVVPPRIGRAPTRPSRELLGSLRDVPVPEVSDAVGRLYTMHPRIRPLYEPVRRTVGVALTVKAHPGDNLAVHGGLGLVQPGDVLVVGWQGYAEGCGTGAESLRQPIRRGLEAVVIDGGWRDVGQLQEWDFPVFGRWQAAFSPAKREPGEINVPVSCGDVIVEAGDVVVADAEGVVVVPGRHLEAVVTALRGKRSTVTPGPTAEAEEAGATARTALFRRAFLARGGEALEL